MWDESDLHSFNYHTTVNQMGQITLDTKLGQLLYRLASRQEFKRYLEVGTWNGLGSTMCFSKGFSTRTDQDYILYSLECNKEKHEIAKTFHKQNPHIHLMNAVIVKDYPSFEQIVKDLEIPDLEWDGLNTSLTIYRICLIL